MVATPRADLDERAIRLMGLGLGLERMLCKADTGYSIALQAMADEGRTLTCPGPGL